MDKGADAVAAQLPARDLRSRSALVGGVFDLGGVGCRRPASQQLQCILGTRARLGGVGEEGKPVVGDGVHAIEAEAERTDDGMVLGDHRCGRSTGRAGSAARGTLSAIGDSHPDAAYIAVMARQRWSDLHPRLRQAVVLAGAVEAALKIAALIDLAQRPAGDVRGSKAAWAVAITVVNAAGAVPVVYFLRGRSRRAR